MKSSDRIKKNPNGISNGWFSEIEAMWPGQKFSLVRPSMMPSQNISREFVKIDMYLPL